MWVPRHGLEQGRRHHRWLRPRRHAARHRLRAPGPAGRHLRLERISRQAGQCSAVAVRRTARARATGPVDQHLNPDPEAIPRALADCARYFVDGQLMVLRSTVFPGVTALVEGMVAKLGRKIDVVFCPERIAEGRAMIELFTLPQIVGASSASGAARAERLFRLLTDRVIHLQPKEAELAKLFTNAWRYIKFATANQFFLIANDCGLD